MNIDQLRQQFPDENSYRLTYNFAEYQVEGKTKFLTANNIMTNLLDKLCGQH